MTRAPGKVFHNGFRAALFGNNRIRMTWNIHYKINTTIKILLTQINRWMIELCLVSAYCKMPDCSAGGQSFTHQTRPTLTVLKWLRTKSILCYDIHKWLDILVFSVLVSRACSRSHALVAKRRKFSSKCCSLALLVFKKASIETSFKAEPWRAFNYGK